MDNEFRQCANWGHDLALKCNSVDQVVVLDQIDSYFLRVRTQPHGGDLRAHSQMRLGRYSEGFLWGFDNNDQGSISAHLTYRSFEVQISGQIWQYHICMHMSPIHPPACQYIARPSLPSGKHLALTRSPKKAVASDRRDKVERRR